MATSSPVLDYLMKKRGGAMPTLLEWLNLNYLGNIPNPLDAEDLSAIPKELRDQVESLPREFRDG